MDYQLPTGEPFALNDDITRCDHPGADPFDRCWLCGYHPTTTRPTWLNRPVPTPTPSPNTRRLQAWLETPEGKAHALR
jgi:hypothetical protein